MRRTRLIAATAAAAALAGVLPASAFGQTDLSADLADSADPVLAGSQFFYTATVANGGAEQANGVTVETTLANEVDFVASTPSQGTCDTQGSKRVLCDLGALPGGASATVEIRVLARRDGQASTTSTVTSTNPPDPNPANDSSTEPTTIQEPAPVSCAGRTATVIGSTDNDLLFGTGKVDVIAGLGGNDEIFGLDGNDVICGGAGNDRIKAGADNDRVKGGPGNDRIRGQIGDDALAGNGGDDKLGGGLGDDALRGGPGADRCGGGPGRDTRRGCE